MGAGPSSLKLGDEAYRSREPKSSQVRGRQGLLASLSASHPALRHGMPKTQEVFKFKQYVSCFDFRTRNPQWVMEHLSRSGVEGNGARQACSFKELTSVPVHLRNRLSDFTNSGYDRGHMAPAANHKGSQEAMNDTFSLSNVSPQRKQFNREYWRRVEHFVRNLTKEWEDVYVVTGPLYLPSGHDGALTIGNMPSLVAVPNHFFKVVLAEKTGWFGRREYAVGAFVVPHRLNKPIPPQTPLTKCMVPIEDLEAVAGMRFFPDLLTQPRRMVLKEREESVGLGRRPFGSLSGNPPLLLTDGRIHANSGGDVALLCERTLCEFPELKSKQDFNDYLSLEDDQL